jgi:hypothetical protein
LAIPIAPALGWAVHSATALPLYRIFGFTTWAVAVGSIAALAVAAAVLLKTSSSDGDNSSARVPLYAYGLAILLGVIPAIAIFPKISGAAVALAPAIFDHSKIAIIDEMTRLGLPPGNPFYDAVGQGLPLTYYYLWHFSAAELSLFFRTTGWESDIALTAFTAISSLTIMIGFATWIGGRAAGLWVVPLALAASLHPVLEYIFGAQAFYSIMLAPTGLAGWLFQIAWAPQHVASASCVVLSTYLLVRLAQQPSTLLLVILALVAAAGFESSTWVGGILFAAVAPVIAIILIAKCPPGRRVRFVVASIGAALLTAALAYPFLRDQYLNAAARGAGSPVTFELYPVFSDWVSDDLTPLLNIPGYWLLLLVIEFPAIYIPGIVSLAASVRSKTMPRPALEVAEAFFGLTVVSLFIAGCFASVIADNNDLGWRAVLPAMFLLTIFAAIGLSRWLAAPAPLAAAGALLLLALGLPKSFQLVTEYVLGVPSVSGGAFAATPALWEAVRRKSAPADHIANSPLFMEKMTPWPANISWALFSNRRSCFAGRDLALPFTPLPRDRVAQIDEQFRRIFSGQSNPDDIRDLAQRYRCQVAVLTAEDGAWSNDPFGGSGYFALADEMPGQWRIYRAVEKAGEPKAAPRP